MNFNDIGMDIPLNNKPKRGAKKKTRSCLQYQPFDCIQNEENAILESDQDSDIESEPTSKSSKKQKPNDAVLSIKNICKTCNAVMKKKRVKLLTELSKIQTIKLFKMKSIYLVLVVSTFLIINIESRTPCKSPKQWKANTYGRDYKSKYESRFEFTYDSVNKRTREIGIEQIGSYSDYVNVIKLFNEKVFYRYSYTRKLCEKKSLKEEWNDFELPNDATFYGDLTIGASGLKDSGLLVSIWRSKYMSNGETFDTMSLVTVNNCIPVSVYLNNDNLEYQLHLFNVTAGINEADFTLPDECL
ncbi:mammalian ependymin-related 1-like [Brachionus plicatilis]|uniref:Mammalian ependymin-related 1-like n=1 Tax=Brachionus plicatilis TaxID=10195 RepID=A0A3M7SST9_BRAPC|nr:mammalian ependymin-related 1-like [Brachionus plicatilis]